MAKGQVIPDPDHILRWVPKTKCTRDPATNVVTGLTAAAFELKPAEFALGAVSVSWVEHYGSGDAAQKAAVSQLKETMVNTQGKCTINKSGAFAIAEVGVLRAYVAEKASLKAVHWPTNKNDGHSRLKGPLSELDVLQAMVAQACMAWRPAQDLI